MAHGEWLEKYPQAAAMLQGASDVLAYQPDTLADEIANSSHRPGQYPALRDILQDLGHDLPFVHHITAEYPGVPGVVRINLQCEENVSVIFVLDLHYIQSDRNFLCMAKEHLTYEITRKVGEAQAKHWRQAKDAGSTCVGILLDHAAGTKCMRTIHLQDCRPPQYYEVPILNSIVHYEYTDELSPIIATRRCIRYTLAWFDPITNVAEYQRLSL